MLPKTKLNTVEVLRIKYWENFWFPIWYHHIPLPYLYWNKLIMVNIRIVLSFRNTILSCFFFIFLVIELYFFIPAVIGHKFCNAAEFAIPIGIPTNEPKAGIENYPVTLDALLRKCCG